MPSTESLPPVRPDTYRWYVLIVVMIGTFMAALDASIVNVSVPAIMSSFGARVDEIEWVITAYMLAYATLMPLTAWLRERMGPKTLFLSSLAVFTIGSLLCGLAPSLPILIGARVLQAFGGGAITPTGMAMVSEVFEPEERGKALGYWGLGVVVGPAIGPTIGGYLTAALGWRSIFLVNLPVGIIAILLGLRHLRPGTKAPAGSAPFDFAGFASLTVGIVSFLLGVSKGEDLGWTSPFVLGCMVLTVFGFALFFFVERNVRRGIIDLTLFGSRDFSAAMLVTFFRSVVLLGSTFLLPLFLQGPMGLGEIETGLILLPGAVVLGAMMPLSGNLYDRVGPRRPAVVGLLLLAYFLFMYRHLAADWSVWQIIVPTLVRGVGVALLVTPVLATAMNAVSTENAGMASAMLTIAQQIAGATGIALLSAVLHNRLGHHLRAYGPLPGIDPGNAGAVAKAVFTRGHGSGPSLLDGLPAHVVALVDKAMVAAFDETFVFSAVAILLAVLLAFLLPNRSIGGRKKGADAFLE